MSVYGKSGGGRRYALVVAAGAFGAWLGACAHAGDVGQVPPADVLFAEAEQLAAEKPFLWWTSDDCDEAIPKYQQVLDNYPFSQFAVRSKLGIADCYFRQEEWADAILHYRDFEKMHPTHAEIWMVRFRLGEAYARLRLDYDRDLADTEQAYLYYSKVASADNPWRAEAAAQAADLASELARRLLYIGRFYERKGEALSALDRYEAVLAAYRQTEEAREAYERAADLYRKLGDEQKIAALPRPAGIPPGGEE